MAYQIATTQDRLRSAGCAALIAGLIAFGLARGLGVDVSRQVVEDLKVVSLLPDAPPPRPDPVPARKQAEKRKEGAASPPNLKSKATEIVAPPPPIVLRQPDPIPVAPVAGLGNDRSAGAAPVPGPGTGSGGRGNGLGSGDSGDGDGGGGGEIPLRLIQGKLNVRDLPRDLQVSGTVAMDFDVGVNGRVTACRVTRSSGNPRLDAATCTLIVAKLRYRPTRDASGRAIPDTVDARQVWTVTHDYGSDQGDGDDRR